MVKKARPMLRIEGLWWEGYRSGYRDCVEDIKNFTQKNKREMEDEVKSILKNLPSGLRGE